MQKDNVGPLSQYKAILGKTVALAEDWHERISQGYIPTTAEAAAFRDQMAVLHQTAHAAWYAYCEYNRDYEIPD